MDSLQLTLFHDKGMWFGVLVSKGNRLVASAFSGQRPELKRHLREYSRRMSRGDLEEGRSPLVYELAKLFDGKKPQGRVTFELGLLTPFQEKIHGVLIAIPTGKVTTYGHIASSLGSGPRAVGNAVGANPWPLFVPCHRVIPSSRLAGEYSMNGIPSSASSQVKRGILEREGVEFIDDRVVPPAIWQPRGP